MSPVYFGSTKVNTLYVGNTKINKGYVGNTLVYSSEFIGTVTITTVIRYAGVLVTDTNCVPSGAEVAMIASISGTATDATFAWTRPAGSSAPVAGLTTGTLTWTAAAGDGGTYGVTVSSRNSSDSTQSAQETINIFSYVAPGFADADANEWIINVELRDCGALELGVRNAMNQLVLDLKSSGFYANSPVIHPLIGARNARALVPIKSPAYSMAPASYDRQKGVRQDNTATTPVTWQYDFSGRVNAGSAGTAVYATSFFSNGLQGGPSPGVVFFNHYGANNTSELTVHWYFEYRVVTPGNAFNTGTALGTVPLISAGNVPVFVGANRTGPLATTNVAGRINSVANTAQAAEPPPTASVLQLNPPNGPSYLSPSFRCDWAFVISGGGSSDYTSAALRTIIETYVAAVQAAIPG
jgi:hypothetical protein